MNDWMNNVKRRITRVVSVGGVKLGGGHPVSIQSMTNTYTADIGATIAQVQCLKDAGCEIVRVSVKDKESAAAIAPIKEAAGLPVVADIHFDHNLALAAINAGADKIRINPGNMKDPEKLARVVDAAGERHIPIRIGINSGSLMEMAGGKGDAPDVMVEAMLRSLEFFEQRGFQDLVLSLKASDVFTTVMCYRKMSELCDYPLHVGVTAAGPLSTGIVKSSMGIGALLIDGIGDTIRVSLTGDPVQEVHAARKILSASGVRKFGDDIISCPTCGRCGVDLAAIVEEVEAELAKENPSGTPLTIAVMGCEVNGPGEAASADVGVAFGNKRAAIFSGGSITKTVDASMAVRELIEEIKERRRADGQAARGR
ncbi:MAG: flavodoxin-dependent (E)-4-hydroxy-3-methylbut-2-enyl-diphosphate synthase [Candidatus Omnitrophica bacterium]|nr:flavodoxin-dependent (E)-4-hydroxy-3-methylbut-2-enyl-diphosphate synthase [Candidatus Omnitrophota bacterium]MDD5487586.1 flavodoxin-dependent (E)-4-hydroxy-3-methylbut-2-enyl-diphosphate synthase [Candidatus Omnitrophota bacterium]